MKLEYRSEIDGLRAIAVIPVILFHAGFKSFSGGYTGVDVFFVISGYLISSIIYSELKANKFSIINFYERRSRRILPLLFCVLLASIPFAWISLFQSDMIDFFESLIAIPTFSSNFLFVKEADYFDTAVELKPLLHTWSLAVEEQFYIIFPLIMLLFFKIIGERRILPILIIAFIISFFFSVWASVVYPKANFYLLPSRAWEIGIGAILGIGIMQQNPILLKLKSREKINGYISFFGLIMIILGFFIIDNRTPFPGTYALLPVIGTALIILFSNRSNITGKILSAKPLVIIGLISYSAYLWHHPIFAFVRHLSINELSLIKKIILSILVFPISYLSWKFIENPFRNKKKITRKSIFIFALIGSLFFILVGFLGIRNEGFPNRPKSKRLDVREYNPDNRALQLDSWNELAFAKSELEDQYWFRNEDTLPNLLLIGNSHSKDVYNILNNSEIAKTNFDIGRFHSQICEYSNPKHPLFSSLNYLNADIIMVVSSYRKVDFPYLESFVDRLIKDQKKVVIIKEIHHFKEVNRKTAADLIIEEYIRSGLDLENDTIVDKLINDIENAYFQDFKTRTYDLKLESDKIINSIKEKNRNIIVLDRMKYVCNDSMGKCFSINSDIEKYFYDYGHHTLEGAKFFATRVDEINWLAPLLENAFLNE